MRLRALADARDAFGSTLDREQGRTAADWKSWLSRGATFVAEEGGQAPSPDQPAVGLVCAFDESREDGLAHLVSMWVDASARGTGAASALVDAALAWAASDGFTRVHLFVVEGNDRARRLYARHGFRLTGHTITRDRDGALEFEMERASSAASDV